MTKLNLKLIPNSDKYNTCGFSGCGKTIPKGQTYCEEHKKEVKKAWKKYGFES